MSTGESRQDQVNLRLSRSYADILEAVSFVDGSRPSAIVREVIEEYLHDRLSDDDVQLLLKVRKRRRVNKATRTVADRGVSD